ncbi:Rrf2 family transcriptional regulator [Aquimarina sp. ERC-38]|uniref:RrF2 family transcriptional regulator n=1 Tax=Aquimarina sp. ERC-38 TaxID=2949996 RepID=UPI0022458987|nr:Rrf2 family transcriptional regulator [Aquimarina sp. ERC-38]UZO79226.1 Rrf2 family transcriptional regulator [Aquimarina sp. ERC-38]
MLSKKTKYGLKAMIYIAKNYTEKPVLISEIAEKEHISQKFLESILLTLKKNELLASKKGKGGGYLMIKNPEDIAMVDIIRILEGPIAMVPCVSLNFYKRCEDCQDEEACAVNELMIEVRDQTLKVLANKTLADFINKDIQ